MKVNNNSNESELMTLEKFLAEDNILTPDEKEEINLKAQIVKQIIDARKNKGITQQELSIISGLKQPLIARIESNNTDAQISTILKLLRPLGLTLAVVPSTSK